MRCGWLTFDKPSPLISLLITHIRNILSKTYPAAVIANFVSHMYPPSDILISLAFQFFSAIFDKCRHLKGQRFTLIFFRSLPVTVEVTELYCRTVDEVVGVRLRVVLRKGTRY